MRITGDRDLRTLKIWRAGIMRDVPPEIDHTVVGMAADGEGEDALLTILMHDVADQLFAEGDATISLEDHLGLVDGLAALSARYWGWSDDIGLTTLEERLRFFALDNIAAEAAVADPPLPVRVAMQGWPRLGERAPGLWELVSAIHAAPGALADAMRSTPATFLHGDWKMGNLGRHRDGRTILLDWAYPGSGPVCWDLAWYLALNCARLPIDKEATIEALRMRARTAGRARRLAGSTCNSTCACSAWPRVSGGRRRWATTTNCAGGRNTRPAAPATSPTHTRDSRA